ncbi:hypothetical protein OUZ56_004293 [Daphnia magna]|uniref:Saposin A-type domain-containing protein n=1 Tax=Daphnia magna TaxID=35525 RepID=A0ABQ9YPC5_9CRUS|nr:hypothetical protein OUZ56_004293 [Daphnia magna]
MRSLLMILFCFVLVIASIEAEKYAVGQEPCTWGPSFWCARRENAEKCGPGAIQHCNVVGWKTP